MGKGAYRGSWVSRDCHECSPLWSTNKKPLFAIRANSMELRQQHPQQVGSTKDALIDALPQASLEASVLPLNPIDDVLVK